MPSLTLTTPITQLPGVGDKYSFFLQNLNIETVADLLYHIPTRYEDWQPTTSIMTLQVGEKATIQGQIHNFKNVFTKNGKKLQTAIIANSTGQLPVIWFNQTYLSRVMQEGLTVTLSGKVDFFSNKLTLISPQFEIVRNVTVSESSSSSDTKLVPIYPETAGLSSKWLRAKIAYCLKNLTHIHDWLTDDLKAEIPKLQSLVSLSAAFVGLHQPQNHEQIQQARHRLAFDELFFLQLESLDRRSQWRQHPAAHSIELKSEQFDLFRKALPFQLTNAQQRSIQDILRDLSLPQPMNRLLEGDVGSGKTVVAAAAAYAAYQSGYQVCLMAPTEILAQQHYQSLSKLLQPLGPLVVLQTSRQKYIRKGEDKPFDIIVGTHALLSDIVNFDRLALVIIDEQHRFGVQQRAKLVAKSKNSDPEGTAPTPHVLSMTATPIPRTIALTLYGDLDLSLLDELPPGRQPIKTWVVPNAKRSSAYDWIKQHMGSANSQQPIANCQVFIVCPFIEPSETISSVKSATEEFERLQSIFPQYKLGLLHGQMKGPEKDAILEEFRLGHMHILVTTPVVEVGVDIPAASIMIIEAAERFGLAQLHQLRGRVGRGSQQAYCLLFTTDESQTNKQRLQAMENHNSGLKLAEIDLQIRGPGQLYGIQQHGYTELKVASYGDAELIAKTRQIAEQLYPRIETYPDLKTQLAQRTLEHIAPN